MKPHGGTYKSRAVVKRSDAFDEYYKAQNIVPADEWDLLLSTLQSELPITFRVVQGTIHSDWIRSKVEAQEFVQKIEWFPGTAYQVESKAILKQFPYFRKFIVSQSEAGTIFRQEAVSFIPALFLPIQSDSWVLDLCAAPGSKTSQVVERLHATSSRPKGLVVANDASAVRGHMLIHRLEHFGSPCLAVTAHEAQRFPSIVVALPNGSLERRLFDCVLADVPCTGDGTARKNDSIWGGWGASKGVGAHRLQRLILKRAVRLTKPGGTIVYSTCSLNPMENEAVVSAALKFFGDDIEVVDCNMLLPKLNRREGLTTWRVRHGDAWYSAYSDVPDNLKSKPILETHFPNIEYETQMKRCMRFLPHLTNGGGFFVAVIRRKSTVQLSTLRVNDDDDNDNENVVPPADDLQLYEGGPLLPLSQKTLSESWDKIGGLFGLPPPTDKILFSRQSADAYPKRIWLASDSLSEFLLSVGKTPPKVLVAGCLIMDKRPPDVYRIPHRAAQWLSSFFPGPTTLQNGPRVARVSLTTLRALSRPKSLECPKSLESSTEPPVDHDRSAFRCEAKNFEELSHLEGPGACLMVLNDIVVPAWVGAKNVELLVDNDSREALDGLLDFVK